MKSMNSIKRSSIILLFAIALLTGFMSVVYRQTANAFSIDLGQIPGLDGLQGLDLSKANTASNVPQGLDPTKADKSDTADNGLQGLDPTKADKSDTADKNAKNSKSDTADTGRENEQASPDRAENFGHLNVMVHTIDLSSSTNPMRSSDFTIHVSGNHLSTTKFPGSEAGTDVKVGAGNYMVTEDMPDGLSIKNGDVNVHFSQDCLGNIQNNEDKTCTITNTIH
jgi:hypothetical protein